MKAHQLADDIKSAILELAQGRSYPDLLEALDSLTALAVGPTVLDPIRSVWDVTQAEQDAMRDDQWTAWKAELKAATEPVPSIEDMCARIKAADDAAADNGYMLDSEDCIAVLRGEWTAPVANDCPPRTSAEDAAFVARSMQRLKDADDAERYRHLVDACNVGYDPSEPWQLVIWEPATGEDWKAKLDAAIDAAIGANP